MRVAILRRTPTVSVSMDVYTAGLISGLKNVRPDWTILDYYPALKSDAFGAFSESRWLSGAQKYYERYWRYPVGLDHIDADIFHIIDHSDGYLSRWLKRSQRPNVVTCHDLINLTQPETYKGLARFPLVSLTLWKRAVQGMNKADHIVTVSEYTKRDTVEYLGIPAEMITAVPNAVECKFQRLPSDQIQALRQRFGLSKETLCLLNVGSNNPRKNVSNILAAVAQLKSRGVPVVFWKAGDDFNTEQQQFIQDQGLAACVSYLGKPDAAALIEHYNAADCLMAASLYEGFGFTILEAMACGTPVVTSNVSAMPEVAGEAAILVNPLDVSAIANAVHRLYQHPEERQQLAQKGFERAQHFTWESTAERVAQVYEQVLATRRSPTDLTPSETLLNQS